MASPVPHDNELTLYLLATGLSLLAKTDRSPKIPYPAPLQRACNRILLNAIRCQSEPPNSVAEIVIACTQEPKRVPYLAISLPESVIGLGLPLLENGLPTQLCREWSHVHADVEQYLVEERVFSEARELCRKRNDQQAYIDYRRVHIEHPVLTRSAFIKLCETRTLRPLKDCLEIAYQPIPYGHAYNDEYHLCKTCGNLLILNYTEQALQCRRPGCAGEQGDTLPADPGDERRHPLWLQTGFLESITYPGLLELQLHNELAQIPGVEVSLWPLFDAVDLQITFSDGTIWAVDIKEWGSATALALRSNNSPIPQTNWHRAFYVFRDERTINYRNEFYARWNRRPNVEAYLYSQFLAEVQNHLKGFQPDAKHR